MANGTINDPSRLADRADTRAEIDWNKGPNIALPSVEDSRAMDRALQGATSGRATGMARQTAEKATGIFKPAKKEPITSIFDKGR